MATATLAAEPTTDAFPDVAALEPVRQLLATLPYSPRCNAAILETIRRDGSVQCYGLSFLTDRDRAAIESVIPGVSPWQWGPETDEVWNAVDAEA